MSPLISKTSSHNTAHVAEREGTMKTKRRREDVTKYSSLLHSLSQAPSFFNYRFGCLHILLAGPPVWFLCYQRWCWTVPAQGGSSGSVLCPLTKSRASVAEGLSCFSFKLSETVRKITDFNICSVLSGFVSNPD